MQEVNHESRSGGIPRPLKCPDDAEGLILTRLESITIRILRFDARLERV
jgi:hypothetical protein